jgi:hypothetical protein
LEEQTMSTYANGTQQTYKQIWAEMESTCAGLMAALHSPPAETVVEVAQPAIEWPALSAGGHVRKHPLRALRRSARGRRKLAARSR